MKKIVSLYQRNYEGDRLVRDEVVPGAEWVVQGEGIATRKYDGTCCMVRDGKLFKRYELKPGKTPPVGWEAAQDEDTVTGKRPGWMLVGEGAEDQYHRAAFSNGEYQDGTYELLGPKIQGGIESEFTDYTLLRHADAARVDAPRTFNELRDWLTDHNDIEGIVWHHPDGRMVKIKGKDFGIRRRDGNA